MKNIIFSLFFLLFLNCVQAQILNIEQQRLKNDSSKWAGKIWGNGSILKNEKIIYNLSSGAHLQYKKNKNLFLIVSNIHFIQADGDNFENAGSQHIRYNYLYNDFIRLEVFTQAQFNKVLNVDFRGLLGIGPRIQALNKDNYEIAAGFLYMYEYEEILKENAYHRDHRLSNYISFKINLNDILSFSNTTYYQPLLKDFSDFRFTTQNNINIRLSDNLSYRLTYNLAHDTKPPLSITKTTYSFTNGLSYTF